MPNYQIITDSGCDLPAEKLAELQLTMVSLSLIYKGKTLPDCVTDDTKEFYAGLRAGEAASTSAINPDQWANAIEPVLAAGKDALVMTFSSGLSTTYQSAVIAAGDLQEKYPDRKVRVVDTVAASLGQGLLVFHTCQMRDSGMELDALADWVENNKLNLCHFFTVDDLMFLKRGGRVSAATAVLGTMLQIKPVLHVDNDGHLINIGKVRGRKASLDALFEKAKKLCFDDSKNLMYICHGDCLDDAQYLADRLRSELGVEEVFIGYTGAVIGSHSGPGTVALFFMGEHR